MHLANCHRNPALLTGYARLEAALVESAHRGLDRDPGHEQWLEANGGAQLPPMNIDQAMTLLFLHKRQARDKWDGMHSPEGRIATDEEVERALKRQLKRMGVKC